MSEINKDDYARALRAIKGLIDIGMNSSAAADKVTQQFSHLIGDDEAACECLYEEADEYEDQRRERAAEQSDMADAGYGEG